METTESDMPWEVELCHVSVICFITKDFLDDLFLGITNGVIGKKS